MLITKLKFHGGILFKCFFSATSRPLPDVASIISAFLLIRKLYPSSLQHYQLDRNFVLRLNKTWQSFFSATSRPLPFASIITAFVLKRKLYQLFLQPYHPCKNYEVLLNKTKQNFVRIVPASHINYTFLYMDCYVCNPFSVE